MVSLVVGEQEAVDVPRNRMLAGCLTGPETQPTAAVFHGVDTGSGATECQMVFPSTGMQVQPLVEMK